jgi:hypothetical protein
MDSEKCIISFAPATLELRTKAIDKTLGAHPDEEIPPLLPVNTSQASVGNSSTHIDTLSASPTAHPPEAHCESIRKASPMANFIVDPLPCTSPSLFLEDGGPHRHARRSVFVSGSAAKHHEDCVIAVINEDLMPVQHHDLMHDFR